MGEPRKINAEEDREQWLRHLEERVGESDKNWVVAFSLSLFFGVFGADLFYLDRMWLGCLKLVTFGGGGIWWIVDVFRFLFFEMRDGEGGALRRPF
jgi:hypothetical protein